MQFLTKEYFRFFDELEHNNNKEWFDVNRERYENHVKKPFQSLVESLIKEVNRLEPGIEQNPSKCIFRINRDIRFSKDKTPYKLHRAAVFGNNGKKTEGPCYYFHVGIRDIEVGGGMYDVSKENLYKIRQEIFYNSEELETIILSKDFKNTFGGIQGEVNKVLPKEYSDFAKTHPYIFKKRFYIGTEFDREEVLTEDFSDKIMSIFRKVKPFNDYLLEAILD